MCVLLCRGVIAQRSVYPALDSWALTLLCRGSCLPRRLSKYSTVQSRMHCARKLAQIPGCNSWCPCPRGALVSLESIFCQIFSSETSFLAVKWLPVTTDSKFRVNCGLYIAEKVQKQQLRVCIFLFCPELSRSDFLLWLRCGENTQIKAGSW